MDSTTKRPGGEQPPSQDQVSGAPLDASHRVSDLRADGNSCAHDVNDTSTERHSRTLTARDVRQANEMLDTLGNLMDDVEEWKSATYCCVTPITTDLYDSINIEVTDAVRASAIEAKNDRIGQLKTWLRELGVDVDRVGGEQ